MTPILVTGGAGYIGSHTLTELTRSGFYPVTLDNLSQGHSEAVQEGDLIRGDFGDPSLLDELLQKYRFSGVVHFAGLCAVGESVRDPLSYYEVNVGKTVNLIQALARHGVRNVVFSSTCAVYGNPVTLPLGEDHPKAPVNPYGETKYVVERILDNCRGAVGLRSISLRYFNAAGASLDAKKGESHDPEGHLIPLTLRAATAGKPLQVFGDHYPTADGTCIRDYVHVCDLATAHVRALRLLLDEGPGGVFNLGTGRGYSVLEIIREAGQVVGREIPFEIAPPRPGDPPALFADARRAQAELDWIPRHSSLRTILETAWAWECDRKY